MGIFSILSRNSSRAHRTRRPDDRVPCPAGYRGPIAHDAARCTGCQSCAYVCSPAAITFDTADPRFVRWAYFAGQCTFCGRCVEYCPTHALAFEESTPPVAEDPRRYRMVHDVPYRPCARCGQPVIPLPLQTLQAMHAGSVPDGIAAQQTLCQRCRQRASALRLQGLPEGEDHG